MSDSVFYKIISRLVSLNESLINFKRHFDYKRVKPVVKSVVHQSYIKDRDRKPVLERDRKP